MHGGRSCPCARRRVSRLPAARTSTRVAPLWRGSFDHKRLLLAHSRLSVSFLQPRAALEGPAFSSRCKARLDKRKPRIFRPGLRLVVMTLKGPAGRPDSQVITEPPGCEPGGVSSWGAAEVGLGRPPLRLASRLDILPRRLGVNRVFCVNRVSCVMAITFSERATCNDHLRSHTDSWMGACDALVVCDGRPGLVEHVGRFG
jgi:hypothetical protein